MQGRLTSRKTITSPSIRVSTPLYRNHKSHSPIQIDPLRLGRRIRAQGDCSGRKQDPEKDPPLVELYVGNTSAWLNHIRARVELTMIKLQL